MAFLWCAKVLLPCWSVDLLMQTRVVGNHRCGEGHQSLRSVWRPVCKRVCLSRLIVLTSNINFRFLPRLHVRVDLALQLGKRIGSTTRCNF
jgi:hypothetical protein